MIQQKLSLFGIGNTSHLIDIYGIPTVAPNAIVSIGYLVQPTLGVVRVLHNTAEIILRRCDAVAAVIRELHPTAVLRYQPANVITRIPNDLESVTVPISYTRKTHILIFGRTKYTRLYECECGSVAQRDCPPVFIAEDRAIKFSRRCYRLERGV